MPVKLSVVIVSFNTKDLLGKCLASLQSAAAKIPLEIFVVDNASTDQSAEMVREKFPEVKIIQNSENLAFAVANNKAHKLCSGEYALWLNSDAEVVGDAVPEMIRFMDSHPEVGILGPKFLNPDGSLQPTGGPIPSRLSELWWALPFYRLSGGSLRDKFRHRGRDYDKTEEVEEIGGACMMIRRQVWEKIGFLDEHYFFGYEDVEYCIRARKHGWKIVYFPQAEAIHVWGASLDKKNPKTPDEKFAVKSLRGYYYYLRQTHGAGFSVFMRVIMAAKFLVKILLPFVFGAREFRKNVAIFKESLFPGRTAP